jgi:hypothetical protein
MGRAFDDEQAVQILREYQSGMTWEALGEKWHAGAQTVRNSARRAAAMLGEELKTEHRSKLTDEQCVTLVLKKTEFGLSNEQLGAEFGVSGASIGHYIKRGREILAARNQEEREAVSESIAQKAPDSPADAPEESGGKFDGEEPKTHTALPDSVWEAVQGRINEVREKAAELIEEAKMLRGVANELREWLDEAEQEASS